MFAIYWWICHFWQLLAKFGNFCNPVVSSSCHPVILSSCHLVIFSSLHLVILSFCHLVSLAACQFVSLWAFQLAHLGACELVLHIGSMISFGGFLAECLPCFYYFACVSSGRLDYIKFSTMPTFVLKSRPGPDLFILTLLVYPHSSGRLDYIKFSTMTIFCLLNLGMDQTFSFWFCLWILR